MSYKKSNVFSAVEEVMNILEYRISDVNEDLKTERERLENLDDSEEWKRDAKLNNIEKYEIMTELLESSYNNIYDNFQKIVSKLTK